MRGAGAGRTQLNCSVKFDSNSVIGGTSEAQGLTIGTTGSSDFYFANGAHDVSFGHVRFRGASYMWDLCDYSGSWTGSAQCQYGNFHDMTWDHCEFEWAGNTSGRYFNMWFDSRAGGGSIYDLTWNDCTFGVKRSASPHTGGVNVHLLIQPSPAEHSTTGPRSDNPNWKSFNWGLITHGSGLAALGGPNYGFRITNCTFIGSAPYDDLNLCDYIRARLFYEKGDDYNYSQAEIDACNPKYASVGWYIAGNWMSEGVRNELTQQRIESNNLEDQGGSAYHASAEVAQHDRELYGL